MTSKEVIDLLSDEETAPNDCNGSDNHAGTNVTSIISASSDGKGTLIGTTKASTSASGPADGPFLDAHNSPEMTDGQTSSIRPSTTEVRSAVSASIIPATRMTLSPGPGNTAQTTTLSEPVVETTATTPKRKSGSTVNNSNKRAKPTTVSVPPPPAATLSAPPSHNKILWLTPQYQGPDVNTHARPIPQRAATPHPGQTATPPSSSIAPITSPRSTSTTVSTSTHASPSNTTSPVRHPTTTTTPPTPPKFDWTKDQLNLFAQTLQNDFDVDSFASQHSKTRREVLDVFGFLVCKPIFRYAMEQSGDGVARHFQSEMEVDRTECDKIMHEVHAKERAEEELKKKREGEKKVGEGKGKGDVDGAGVGEKGREQRNKGREAVVGKDRGVGKKSGVVEGVGHVQGKGGSKKVEGGAEGIAGGKKAGGVGGGAAGNEGKAKR